MRVGWYSGLVGLLIGVAASCQAGEAFKALLDPARVPQSVEAVWAFLPEVDHDMPLETETLRDWEESGIRSRLLRFTVIELDGVNTRVLGYYAHPVGGDKLPAVLAINGGPERAFLHTAREWAAQGYACFNPHISETHINDEADKSLMSDWGLLYQGGKRIKAGAKSPWNRGEKPKIFDPRNDEYFGRTVVARRCITLLQSMSEVNPERIGIRGHSTGGVLTVHSMIDPRLKAAVPSVGGPGYWYTPQPYRVGTTREPFKPDSHPNFYRTMARQLYWRRVACPVLFLGASNDFNSPLDNIARSIQEVPHADRRLIVAPRRNHNFNDEAGITASLWFEQHLKQTGFRMPAAPRSELVLKTEDGIPRYRLWPDAGSEHAITRVEIYYAYDRNPMSRYWSDAEMVERDGLWEGKCPIFELDEPLFVYGNVYYREHGGEERAFMVTADFQYAFPEAMQDAGVKPTETRQRMLIEEVGRFEAADWSTGVGKMVDPRWMGPRGASVAFEVFSSEAGNWIGISTFRRYHGVNSGEAYYYAWKQLDVEGWNAVTLSTSDFRNNRGRELDRWDKCTGITIGAVPVVEKSYRKFLPRAGKQAVETMPDGVSPWRGESARVRNVRWVGGTYEGVTKSYEKE